jgi:hypothetical protein
MADERRGGPIGMSAHERTAFLATQPTGAICIQDEDGRLLAMPARILGEDGDSLSVEVAGEELASAFDRARQGCVVADTFESYEGIRGVIVRGLAARAGNAMSNLVAVRMARTTTFSFAGDRVNPGRPQPD